jgi:hypothetical protein
MNSKIFLLITDDPDDFIEFSSALDEISPEAVLLTIPNSQKAKRVLEERILVPHCVLINLLMHDANVDQILSTLASGQAYAETRKIAYGGEGVEFNTLSRRQDADFLRSGLPYSELRSRLTKIILD